MSRRMYEAVKVIRERYQDAASDDGLVADVRELKARRDALAGKLWESAAAGVVGSVDGVRAIEWAFDARVQAESEVIDHFIAAALPGRAVHDIRHRNLYERAQSLTPVPTPDHIDDPGSDPERVARAESAGVRTEVLGSPADYGGTSPVEDVAVAPDILWTEADEVAALERVIALYGIEPGQWYEVDWPPFAHLYNPGHVYQTEWTPCEKHADQDAPDGCADCDASSRDVVESAAEWKIFTDVRCLTIVFGDDGIEDAQEVFSERNVEIRTLTQDPRNVLLGGPGRGVRR